MKKCASKSLGFTLSAFLLFATDTVAQSASGDVVAQSALDSVRVPLDADQEEAALRLARPAVDASADQAASHCALALVQIQADEHEE